MLTYHRRIGSTAGISEAVIREGVHRQHATALLKNPTRISWPRSWIRIFQLVAFGSGEAKSGAPFYDPRLVAALLFLDCIGGHELPEFKDYVFEPVGIVL